MLNSLNPKTTVSAYKRLFVTATIVFLLDQLTKLWIINNIAFNSYFYPHDADVIEVVRGFFYIVHIGNKGAAWGILSGHGEVLVLFTLIALGVIYKFRSSLELHRKSMQIAFGMLIGIAILARR